MVVLWNGFGIHNYGHGSDNLIIMSNFISDGKQLTANTNDNVTYGVDAKSRYFKRSNIIELTGPHLNHTRCKGKAISLV